MDMKANQSGFTLIELIVVVALLGILAAVALPRFIDVQDQARLSTVKAISGSYQSAVMLLKAQADVNGTSYSAAGLDDIAGYGADTLDINTSGYAVDTGGTNDNVMTAARCVLLWDALLQSGAPGVNTGTTEDYQATAAGAVCNYELVDQATLDISYDVSTGGVSCLQSGAACP